MPCFCADIDKKVNADHTGTEKCMTAKWSRASGKDLLSRELTDQDGCCRVVPMSQFLHIKIVMAPRHRGRKQKKAH